MAFRFKTGSLSSKTLGAYKDGYRSLKHKRKSAPKTEVVVDAAQESRTQGQEFGYRLGFEEGYLRGQANAIVNTVKVEIPHRDLHIMYVSTGKTFPYTPIDEALIMTLQSMVGRVSVSDQQQAVAQRAIELRPDLVLVLDGMVLPLEQVREMREQGIRTAVWFSDDPYYADVTTEIAKAYDDVFTMELNCISYYQSQGCSRVHYLPFGFHPSQYRPITEKSSLRRDMSFVGSAYWNRVAFFDQLAPYLADKDIVISGQWWDRLREFETLRGKIDLNKWMGAQETSDVYNGAKIVINMHRSYDDESVNQNATSITAATPNIRTFEIAASGTLQLTDARNDLSRFYTPGVEIETYSSQQELIEKVEFYLTHEQERREMALRALARSLREHTFSSRVNTMLKIVFG